MRPDCRTTGWLGKAILLLGLAGLILIPQAAAAAEDEYDFYYRYISGDLGPGYAEEYYNLVKGNYRYTPKLAEYCIYAFANGFRAGYWHGTVNRQHVDSGSYASYTQQLKAAAEEAYNQNLSVVRSWQGIQFGAGRNEVEIALYGGWRAGWNRGYREKGGAAPQPTNSDFRFAWSPGKSIDPLPSDDDPYGELRHAR
jgi:hypothetical protein